MPTELLRDRCVLARPSYGPARERDRGGEHVGDALDGALRTCALRDELAIAELVTPPTIAQHHRGVAWRRAGDVARAEQRGARVKVEPRRRERHVVGLDEIAI